MRKWLIGLLMSGQILGAMDAIDFTLPALQGEKQVSMKEYGSGVVLLNLWASWCKACKKEMPIVNNIATTYQAKGVTVIAVNIDSKPNKAQKFLNKLESQLGDKVAIVFAYDAKKSLANGYQAKAIPLTILIKNGVVVKRYLGSFHEGNKQELINDIEAALQ